MMILFEVFLKMLIEFLIGMGIVAVIIAIVLFTLWIWNKVDSKSFDKFLAKLARYFK